MSIHQPRSQIVSLFDDIILISEGEMVYNGPMKLTYDYFKRNGFKCLPNYNQADYFLDIISMDYRSKE